MRHLFLFCCVMVGVTACGTSSRPEAKDPKAPAEEAVLIDTRPKTPPPAAIVAPSAPKVRVIPEDPTERLRALNQGYALAAATMVNQDGRMLAQLYEPGATLVTPDSTITNAPAVVRHLLALARSKSLSDFQRTSRTVAIVDDSTLTDSGSYVMILKRSPQDSVFERGAYAATWRARKDIAQWVMLRDHIVPAKAARKPGGR